MGLIGGILGGMFTLIALYMGIYVLGSLLNYKERPTPWLDNPKPKPMDDIIKEREQ